MTIEQKAIKRGDLPSEVWNQLRFAKFVLKYKNKDVPNPILDPESASAMLWRHIGDYSLYNSDFGSVTIADDEDKTVVNGRIVFGDTTIAYNNFDFGDFPAIGMAIKTKIGDQYKGFRNGNNAVPVNYLKAERLTEDEVYKILETRDLSWGASVVALVQAAEQYWLEDESHRENKLRERDEEDQ